MTKTELAQGWAVCDCGRYAHVFRNTVLRRIDMEHPDYLGEMCKECGSWMCAIDKLPST